MGKRESLNDTSKGRPVKWFAFYIFYQTNTLIKQDKELLIIFFDTIELLVPRLVFLGIKLDCTLTYEIRVLLVLPHAHQAKVLKYPLNENFLSLQIVTLRSQLIFSFWGHLFFLS
ncbi:hypothetical protein COM49_29810 [Bacillus pseudomycoides]|nr:hypothetical protein DJ94_5611 [Bacillus pseudomycoides]MDR4190774.1 hypothetical protein [Bacillus pseudomycoides]PEO73371.1 hypothetical protein CN571_31265 [Bacillus pseudomycoides]PGD90043.1 hypothetical protein COM49_29810 [Bacillus pseudomycoides]PHG17609.1 hypothetical protein COI47_22595 [Bacillus pseudomycoides]